MLEKSIYKKLEDEFAFLNKYGFLYTSKIVHYVMPSVIFQKQNTQIQIGYSYEEHRFFINIVNLALANCYSYNNSTHLLNDVTLIGTSFEQQVNRVKKFLSNYLNE